MPIRNTDFISRPLALADPVPLTVAILMTTSLTLVLIGTRPVVAPAAEVRQVSPCDVDRSALVGNGHVDDAVLDLDLDGPDVVGPDHAQPATFDHGRSAHPDVGCLGRDDHVATAEEGGVAGEAPTRGDADQRDQSAQAGEEVEGHRVETRDAGAVRVAGPTAAALGEEHERQALPLGDLEETILLAVVL
jgi:hypothetical protein